MTSVTVQRSIWGDLRAAFAAAGSSAQEDRALGVGVCEIGAGGVGTLQLS